MALAHARKIVVGGVNYGWSIPVRKSRRYTPPVLNLFLQAEGNGEPVRRFECSSKLWTDQDSYDAAEGGEPRHKATFGPGQVRQVIEGARDLENWTVAEV